MPGYRIVSEPDIVSYSKHIRICTDIFAVPISYWARVKYWLTKRMATIMLYSSAWNARRELAN
jgi:hypothetical protein